MREQEVLDEAWLRDAVSSMMEEQLQVPLYMVDPGDGSIIWSNRAFATLYGYGVEEIRRLTVFDLHFPEDEPSARRLLRRIVRNGHGSQVRHTRRKDETRVEVRVEARLVRHQGKDLILSMATTPSSGNSNGASPDAEGDRDAISERFEVFNQILRTVSFSLDLEWMARKVSELARGLIPHDRLSLTLISPAQDVAVVHAIVGESPVLGRGALLPLGPTSNAGSVVATGRTIVRSDLRREGPFIEREPLLAAGIHSFVSTPMWSQGVCIGTLNIGSLSPGAYGANEARIAEEISANIGEMVTRSRYLSNMLTLVRPRSEIGIARAPGDLSARELEVLRLLAAGKRNAQIARDLGLSPNSVKFHVANVFSKLGVHSRLEATLVAARRGLVEIATTIEPRAGWSRNGLANLAP